MTASCVYDFYLVSNYGLIVVTVEAFSPFSKNYTTTGTDDASPSLSVLIHHWIRNLEMKVVQLIFSILEHSGFERFRALFFFHISRLHTE